MAGLHCLEVGDGGPPQVSFRKLRKHALKLFFWVFVLAGLVRLWGVYRDWILRASAPEIALAFLVKAVVFLYLRIFWPHLLMDILPGLRRFLCPQCFQYQTFRFTPYSFHYGFLVTYLCRYCFCLVDNWGQQLHYPAKTTWGKTAPLLLYLIPVSAGVILGALIVSKILWGLL